MSVIKELPADAIRVSARCYHCNADVETDGSNRCPTCGAETRPESRERRRIVRLTAIAEGAGRDDTGGGSTGIGAEVAVAPARAVERADGAAPKAQPGAPAAVVVLSATREARTWSTARQKLLAVLERQEAAAMERFEAARAEVQRIRRERAAMARDCELIVVDAGPPEVAGSTVTSVSTRRVKGVWPVKVGPGIVERCRGCGTTEQPPYRYGPLRGLLPSEIPGEGARNR